MQNEKVACYPERSEAKSRYPVESGEPFVPGSLDCARDDVQNWLRSDRQDLPALVITARRTGSMWGDRAPALGALIKL